MLFENAFKCTFQDCAVPCIIAFIITLSLMIIGHVVLYFKMVAIARSKYGSENLPMIVDRDVKVPAVTMGMGRPVPVVQSRRTRKGRKFFGKRR
jgi:hypothetical protein